MCTWNIWIHLVLIQIHDMTTKIHVIYYTFMNIYGHTNAMKTQQNKEPVLLHMSGSSSDPNLLCRNRLYNYTGDC